MEKETIEEAAENYTEFWLQNKGLLIRDAFIEGAKWQAERMYSEEDVINAFNEGQALNVRGKLIQGKEWFERAKKK